jgi:uncharacterized DUF497 family protein
MEFDWSQNPSPTFPPQKEIEESFEDPFAIRLLPESLADFPTRYFLLGRAVSGRPLFHVFRTDGKTYRVVASREMTEAEVNFYERKNAESQS